MPVITVPDMVGLVVPVPDMAGRVELVVPLPQPGKKTTAVTAPNNIASGIFGSEQQDFGFIGSTSIHFALELYRRDPRVIRPYICGNLRVHPSNTNPAL